MECPLHAVACRHCLILSIFESGHLSALDYNKLFDSRTMRIAFCHPDLGIGGAERFIVDVADEMLIAGHTVHLYTSHYDVSRCAMLTISVS